MTTEQEQPEPKKQKRDSGTTITGVQLLVGIIFVPVVMPDGLACFGRTNHLVRNGERRNFTEYRGLAHRPCGAESAGLNGPSKTI